MLILVVVFIFFWYFIIDRGFILSPGSVFFYYNSLVVIQTLRLAKNLDIYVVFLVLNLFAFLIGSYLIDTLNKTNVSVRYRKWIRKEIQVSSWNLKHRWMLYFALILTVVGVYTSGGLVPLKALAALYSSGSERASSIYIDSRINISHGSNYLAPGYIAQFKDYIFPTLATIYFFRKLYNRKIDLQARVIMILAMMGLISSGTRSGLFIFIIAILFIRIKPLDNRLYIGKKGALVSLVVLFSFFGGLTMLMGRAGESSSITEGVVNGITQVLDRVAKVTAEENLKLFQDHRIMDDSVFAHEWLRGISTVLPGRQVPYSIHFAHLVGYSRGNVPLNALSGLYFNFNYWGVVVSFLYGLLLRYFLVKLLDQRKTLESIVFLTFLSFHVGLALNPLGILLYGTVTLIILWFFLRLRYAK